MVFHAQGDGGRKKKTEEARKEGIKTKKREGRKKTPIRNNWRRRKRIKTKTQKGRRLL